MRTFWLGAALPLPRSGAYRLLSLGGLTGSQDLMRSHSSGVWSTDLDAARTGMSKHASSFHDGDERDCAKRRTWSLGGSVGFLIRRLASSDSLKEGGR
jgi:hypothetical protein